MGQISGVHRGSSSAVLRAPRRREVPLSQLTSDFKTILDVDENGIVENYEDIWLQPWSGQAQALCPILCYCSFMQPTEEQFTALGNYRDIIAQHAADIAEAIGVSAETLTGWMEGQGEPTREQADQILEYLDTSSKKSS